MEHGQTGEGEVPQHLFYSASIEEIDNATACQYDMHGGNASAGSQDYHLMAHESVLPSSISGKKQTAAKSILLQVLIKILMVTTREYMIIIRRANQKAQYTARFPYKKGGPLSKRLLPNFVHSNLQWIGEMKAGRMNMTGSLMQ